MNGIYAQKIIVKIGDKMDIDNLFKTAIPEKHRRKLSSQFDIIKINEFAIKINDYYKENKCYPVFNVDDLQEFFNDKDTKKSPYVLSSSLYLFLKTIGIKLKKIRYQDKVKIIIDEEKLLHYLKNISKK